MSKTTNNVSLEDLASLARAAGAAGRSWMDWSGDDAVQDFVLTAAQDDDLATWRVAFDAGEAEYLASQGWVSRWTTAPTDYDTFGTTTAVIYHDEWHGKPLRRVLCHPYHAGYQASRNGSGMHPTWDVDPRIEAREAAERAERAERWRADDAKHAAKRAEGLAWLAAATESEIDAAEDLDDDESRGLTYLDIRDELKRRADNADEIERSATWARCRAAFADDAILVDVGEPSKRGVYGPIPGRDSHVYYGAHVHTTWTNVADKAEVKDCRGETVGSLALVADWIASGRLRVTGTGEVPPEPVVRRIGHERYHSIVRATLGDRAVWVGRPRWASEPLILDAAGKIVRAKDARAAALDAYAAVRTGDV